jgi:hypothetical protein
LAVLAAEIYSDSVSDTEFRDSQLKNGTSLKSVRTPAKIRRLRLITEIRHMVGDGRSYREIMDTLGIPERSFYRYLSQAFEHDRQLLAEQDKDKLALELSILHDRLTSAYRRL